MSQTDVGEAERAIRDQHHQATKELSNGNLEALMAAYADDVVMMPPNEAERVGKVAVRSMWENLLKDFTAEVVVSINEVQVLGEWAFERGTFTMELTPRTGGPPVHDLGKYLDVLRRQPDGSYKYTRLMFNSSQAPST